MRNISRSTHSRSDIRRALHALGFRHKDRIATFSHSRGSPRTHRYSAAEAVCVLLELQASNVIDIRWQLPMQGRLNELAS